jgi:iron complex transport system ATP-binding protein
MEPSIAIQDVSFGYDPRQPAFMRDLSLEIPAGHVCALLGPNGSGKTTLLLMILGLLAPRSGMVKVAGIETAHARRAALKQAIGLVPQDESTPFALSVCEYVLLGRAPHLGLLEQPSRLDRELAIAALEKSGISALKDRAITTLSGGERQLAMVARVMVQDPKILLMDEPTSHLDLANTRRIIAIMRRLKVEGKTVVFSTHDPNTASAVADYVVLMQQGAVMSMGRTAEVLTSAHLSAVYGVPVEVRIINARPWIVVD